MSKKLSGVKTCIMGLGQLNGDLRIFAANFIHFPLVLARQWASSSLNSKLTGMPFRVPGPDVSALGLNTLLKKAGTMSRVFESCLDRLHVCLLPDWSQCVSSLSVVCCALDVCANTSYASQLVSEEGADIRPLTTSTTTL